MIKDFKFNGVLYLGYDLSDEELLQENNIDINQIEIVKDPAQQQLEDLEAAIVILAYGGEN